jgi:hypothetical protein
VGNRIVWMLSDRVSILLNKLGFFLVFPTQVLKKPARFY